MSSDQQVYIRIAKKIKRQLQKKGQENLFWLQYYEKQSLYLCTICDNKLQIEVVSKKGKSTIRVAPSDPLYSFLTLHPGGNKIGLGSAVELSLVEDRQAGIFHAQTTLDKEPVVFWGAFIYGTNGGRDFSQLASLMLFGNPLNDFHECRFKFRKVTRRRQVSIDFDEHEKRPEPVATPTPKAKPQVRKVEIEEEIKSAERTDHLEEEINRLRTEGLKNAERNERLEEELNRLQTERDQLQSDLLARGDSLKQAQEQLGAKTSECECLHRSLAQLQDEIEQQNQALTDIQFQREREKEEAKARGLQKLMNNFQRDPKLLKEIDELKQKIEDMESEKKSLKEKSEKLLEKLELVTIQSTDYENMFKQQISENDKVTKRLDDVNSMYAASQSRVKSLEGEIVSIKEDSKTDRDMLINENRKKIEQLVEKQKKELETAAADFQLEKEILERKQHDHDEALKMKEQEKNQTIETLTSDRNALQRKVESIRKDLLSKFSKQESFQKQISDLKQELWQKKEQIQNLKHDISIQKKINPKEERRKSIVPIKLPSLKKSSNLDEVQNHYKQIIANLTSTIADKEDTIRMLHESQNALAARLLEAEEFSSNKV